MCTPASPKHSTFVLVHALNALITLFILNAIDMRLQKLCAGLAVVCITTFAAPLSAQQAKPPFGLPATLPVPEWVQKVDWGHPNIFAIDSMIAMYKDGEREEEENEGGFHEEPYINAYIRWRNKMAPFLQPDGSIQYDAGYHKQQLLRSLENQHSGTATTAAARTTTAANWSLLGPTQTYSQGGVLKNHQANIYCIAVSASNPSVLYASSEPGTLFRTANKGLNWVSVTDTLYSCLAMSIAIDPHNENIVYTYDGTSHTLLKTTTGGAGWSTLSSFTGGGGNAIVINPSTGRILITGSTTIYYSDDNGSSWTAASGGTVTGTLYDLAMNPTGTDTIYAVGSTSGNLIQFLRSTNGGSTFTNVTSSAVSTINTSGARLGVTPASTNVVYCVNLGNSTPPCVIKTTNRGTTWDTTVTSTATGLTGTNATTGLGMSNGQGYYDLGIVVSPANANDVIVGTTTSYKSTDGGVNFSPLGGYHGSFGLHPDMQCAVAKGGDAYIATDGGVNYSSDFFTNTTNWAVRDNGLRSSDFWGFGQGWDEDIVVGGRYHNGNTAIADYYGGGKSLSLGGGESATGHVFHGRGQSTGFRDIGTVKVPTTLGGSILYPDPSVPNTMWPQDDYYGLFASKLVVDPRYSNTFYLGMDSILWKSTNSGASYTALHNFGINNKVWRFEIARSKPSVIYACARNGFYKTTNAGATWAQLTLPVSWSYYNTDVAVNPLNENEVYVCMAQATAANKVFKSLDGGSTWVNYTGSVLSGKPVSFLQFHGGTNHGIYAITNTRPSKVYYRDSSMSDWAAFSTGLPASLEAREGALIFYRDNKMRLCGNCSVWETPLYATGAPVAQPMADRQYVGCTRDTVNFYDYSMVNYAGATRTWSFPGSVWVSSTSARTPQVLYPGPGYYAVTLTVTNSAGQTNSHTVDSMIYVSDDHCAPDTVAGLCIQLNKTSQTVNLGTANINSNNFTISAWIQPKGLQSSFSQIVSHPAYPGSNGYGFGFGFTFSGYTPNLKLCYTDSMVNYGNSSTLICDSTKWNYVVLTYSPNGVVIYLNGVGDTVNSYSPMPVINLSLAPFMLNYDVHNGQGSKFNGKIDEVKIFNYALSQSEVREKMHLITDPATEPGLVKYYQFNQYDQMSGSLYDVKNNFSVTVPSANIVTSTAPVATGVVYRDSTVNSAGLNDLSAAHVKLHLPTGGTYPNGEVVAFHLNSNPDTKPDARPIVKGYFVLNNYGTNPTFTTPDSIVLSKLRILYPGYHAGDFRLYKRATGDFGNTWGAELDSACTLNYAATGSSLTWKATSGVTSFNSQFVIVNDDTTHYNTGIVNANKNNITISDAYPNPCREWLKLDIGLAGISAASATFTITSETGTVITRLQDRLDQKTNTELIHLPKLATGIYFVTTEIAGAETATRKFLVE